MNLTANATETFTITDNTTGNTIPITATVTVNPASHSLDISKTNATTIPDFTFAQKKYLLKIKLPHNLKPIGLRVFSNCGRLDNTNKKNKNGKTSTANTGTGGNSCLYSTA